ncbi:MAG TPA: hypothetical protein PK957_00760 [Candidatus Dojkabacteria bacterium]|nr:hypothetical protein [Candidatus Dojkabacteria bacterium]
MDLNQVNQALQQQIGVAMTEEEQNAFVQVFQQSGLAQQQTVTDKLIAKLVEKGVTKELHEEVVKQAMALANLYLMSEVVKKFTDEELDKVSKAFVELEPLQSAELLSALMEKKTGMNMEDMADAIWEEVVNAFIHDIDMFIEEAKKAS